MLFSIRDPIRDLTGFILTLPYSIREVSAGVFSSPGLVHMLCHFSSAKKTTHYTLFRLSFLFSD